MLLTRIPMSESSWGLKSKPNIVYGKNSISTGTKFAPLRFISFEFVKTRSLNLHKRQTLASEVLDLNVFEHLQNAAYGKIACDNEHKWAPITMHPASEVVITFTSSANIQFWHVGFSGFFIFFLPSPRRGHGTWPWLAFFFLSFFLSFVLSFFLGW